MWDMRWWSVPESRGVWRLGVEPGGSGSSRRDLARRLGSPQTCDCFGARRRAASRTNICRDVSDTISIYLLSFYLDVDYYDLRERDYPLLAPRRWPNGCGRWRNCFRRTRDLSLRCLQAARVGQLPLPRISADFHGSRSDGIALPPDASGAEARIFSDSYGTAEAAPFPIRNKIENPKIANGVILEWGTRTIIYRTVLGLDRGTET